MTRLLWLSLVNATLLVSTTAHGEKILRDLGLAEGFRLSALQSTDDPVEIGVVLASKDSERPAWRLAQWGSRFNLQGAPEHRETDGTRRIQNAGKTVTIHPGALAGEGITLAVNGIGEYGEHLREKGEPWPHLLIEQRVQPPRQLAALDRLQFEIAFRVGHCHTDRPAEVDPSLHTAHSTAFWTIHNQNKDSADHGEMIWFGVPLFDARHDVPKGHQSVDQGQPNSSGKFICTIEGSRFYDRPTGDGEWHEVSRDLIPLVKEALAASQEKGYLTETAFEDLHVTSFNLGWEVPGPYDCAITVKGLRLDQVGG